MKRKSKECIPFGDYCYKSLRIDWSQDKKWPPFTYKVEPCPYYKWIEDEDGLPIAYCEYCNESDSTLLDDQCKICGENYDERQQ